MWTDLLRLEAKSITVSKTNISRNVICRFLSVVVSKNYVTNVTTLCSVCRITVDTVEVVKCVIMPNLALVDNNTVIYRGFFDFQDGGRPPSWIFESSNF